MNFYFNQIVSNERQFEFTVSKLIYRYELTMSKNGLLKHFLQAQTYFDNFRIFFTKILEVKFLLISKLTKTKDKDVIVFS